MSGLKLDLYAFLVNYKDSLELVAHRTAYYKFMIRAVLRILGVPDDKVHFVEASSYELSKDFMLDSYKLSALTDEKVVRETGSEYRHSTKLSVLLCPGLPALAEEYLDSDFQFGGEDQVFYTFPAFDVAVLLTLRDSEAYFPSMSASSPSSATGSVDIS